MFKSLLAALAISFVALTSASAQQPIDINTATASQLDTLPGIGPKLAERIIAARPYANKAQLTSRGLDAKNKACPDTSVSGCNQVLPDSTYDKLKDLVIAKQK